MHSLPPPHRRTRRRCTHETMCAAKASIVGRDSGRSARRDGGGGAGGKARCSRFYSGEALSFFRFHILNASHPSESEWTSPSAHKTGVRPVRSIQSHLQSCNIPLSHSMHTRHLSRSCSSTLPRLQGGEDAGLAVAPAKEGATTIETGDGEEMGF